MLHSLVGRIPNFTVVSSDGMQHRGDRLHYDTPSARMLGERYAEAVLALRQGLPATAP